MRDGWVEATLGQISKCAGGCAFPDAFQGNKEGIPFIKVSDMNSQDNEKYIATSNNSVSGEVVNDLRLRIWDKGTVIFPKVGAALLTEKRRILTKKTIFDNNIMGLVPNERVLSEFLFLLLLQIRFSDHVQLGAVPSIKNSIVEAISVLLPSLDEQQRIVDLVSSVDSYIKALQQQLDSAKRSRNAVLHELLTAGGDDWVESTLGEICADGLFADGDWVESKDQDPEGDYRLLQLADIGDGTFLNKSDRWMNREQFNRLGCTKLEVNDVLIARMPDPIGRACLFPEGLPVCATVVDVAIVRTGNETLQKFLALLINSSDFRTEAFSLLTGTTRQRISRGNLAKISFVIPSQIKQLEIVNLISLFDGEIAQSVRVIEEAKLLRSGLLSDLLSGEHEIPVTYDKVMGAA
jgi:restriction endonuclease S subunit